MRHLRFDPVIVFTVLALAIMGTMMVYSASAVIADREYQGDEYHFLKRQSVFLALGIIIMVFLAMIPYEFWGNAVIPLLFISLASLSLVLTPLGHTANNASRWFKVGPVSLQVAEFTKVVVIMYLARYLAGRGEEVCINAKVLIRPMVILGIIVLLVAAEPDLGTAIFIGLLGCSMFFLAGVPIRILTGIGLAAVPIVTYMIVARDFRVQRIQAFLDPWKQYDGSGFQLVQSFLAFGDGGLFGTGLGAGRSKLLFLPESHTDFILSVIGEELGFVGVSIVLALFAMLIVRGMQIARAAPDPFGSLLASGLTLMIGLQVLINSMVALGLLPTKGIPLPFISYGGSSLLTSMVAVGILLNVAARGRPA